MQLLQKKKKKLEQVIRLTSDMRWNFPVVLVGKFNPQQRNGRIGSSTRFQRAGSSRLLPFTIFIHFFTFSQASIKAAQAARKAKHNMLRAEIVQAWRDY
jgi:hypothetical protein